MYASGAGRVEMVRQLLAREELRPNMKDSHNQTALMRAVGKRQTDVAKLLINSGKIDLHVKGSDTRRLSMKIAIFKAKPLDFSTRPIFRKNH